MGAAKRTIQTTLNPLFLAFIANTLRAGANDGFHVVLTNVTLTDGGYQLRFSSPGLNLQGHQIRELTQKCVILAKLKARQAAQKFPFIAAFDDDNNL